MQENVSPAAGPGRVSDHAQRAQGLPYYTVADDALEVGASLGNSALWVNTKGTGAIERVFSVECGQMLLGSIAIRYACPGSRLQDLQAVSTGGTPHVALLQEGPGTFEIHPAYQRHSFLLAGSLAVQETTFLPLSQEGIIQGDPPVVYQIVQLHNHHSFAQDLRMLAFARLRGALDDDVVARYDEDLGALIAHNPGQPHLVRILGLSQRPGAYATSFDYGRVYNPLHVAPLDNSTRARGDILGCLELDLRLEPGETRTWAVITAVSGRGEGPARAAYCAAQDYQAALAQTLAYLEETLGRAQVATPDPLINQGALWSKVNMRRVMACYPQGPAFTNEPGVSSNVVARDVAWFVYGNDHFLPGFSRRLLDTFAALQYDSGKIPEYYSAIDGHVEDYGLNINDDTPLFILAVNHHYRASGDQDWLRGIYPAVARAARYIISQEDERGLVYCTARDPRGNVWAIAGWRNVIPLYSLNGAVTELNAECAAALRAAGHLAENLELPEGVAGEFFGAAQSLREAMDRHLLNPQNGTYYLNIDVDGNIHTDVTGDELFPVMLRVCSEETGFRIISRLNAPDFWTPAGLRTVSQHDPLYDPAAAVGLQGGVWPGLTWWYAFAAARYHPEFMVRALRASFEHYGASPKINNTVPGQFSEWFDGESLVNRGMRLSPWEPPRFLWAAVEGVCGLMLTPGMPTVNPLVPADWKWVALSRLPYHGQEVTFFAARQDRRFHIYANVELQTGHQQMRYDEDVSEQVQVLSSTAAVVALRRPAELVVLIGNVGSRTSVVPFGLERLVEPDAPYTLRVYNSERRAWETHGRITGRTAAALGVGIEANGFRIVELKAAGA